MNAVLSVGGIKVNFYRWPMRTYNLMKDFAEVKEGDIVNQQEALLLRFRLFGVLMFLFWLLIPVVSIFYPSVVGFHFGEF